MQAGPGVGLRLRDGDALSHAGGPNLLGYHDNDGSSRPGPEPGSAAGDRLSQRHSETHGGEPVTLAWEQVRDSLRLAVKRVRGQSEPCSSSLGYAMMTEA